VALGPWTGADRSVGTAWRTVAIRPALPSAQGALSLTVPGSSASLASFAGPTWTVALPPAALVSAIVKTPKAYRSAGTGFRSQCRVEVSYQVQDAEGRLPVRVSGLSASLALSPIAGGGATSAGCGAPDAASGAGVCTVAMCNDALWGWFSAAGPVLVSAVVKVWDAQLKRDFSTPALSLVLDRIPQHEPSAAAGMAVEYPLPNMPRYAGDALELSLLANTGGYPLKMWGVQLNYDPTVFSYVEGSFAVASSLYSPPLLVTDKPGVIVASVSKPLTTTDAAVTSARLPVATVSLLVKGGARAGLAAGALSCLVTGMLNSGGNQYVTDQPAQILDLHGGYRTSGDVLIAQAQPVGLYAYAASSVLVNWAALGVTQPAAAVTARAVYDRFGAADVTVAAACSAGGGVPLAVPGCGSVAPSGASRDGGLAAVTAAFGGASASVAFRVWAPLNASVQVLDPTLNRIGSPCAAPLYQRTLVSATALFASGDGPAPALADVTAAVTLQSSRPAVAGVAPPYVTGVAAGSAAVSIAGATAPVAAAAVTVSDAEVTVAQLGVTALSAVQWRSVSTPVAPDGAPDQLAYAALQSSTLTRTAPTALLLVTARFSDGAAYLVTRNDGVEVTTANAGVLAVSQSGDAWLAQRVVSGELSVCGPPAAAAWRACGGPVASGTGVLDVELPAPVSATLAFTSAHITSPSDPWAGAPRSFPTSSVLTALTVRFADGTSATYPAGLRISLRIAAGQSLATLSGFSLAASGAGAGTVTLTASMSGMGNVTATYQVAVSTFAAVGLELRCNGGSCAPVTLTSPADPAAAQPFNFPTVYALFTVLAHFTDGSVQD
jgi:hypothetical protein